MKKHDLYAGRNDHLKRLPKKHYQGQAYVHTAIASNLRQYFQRVGKIKRT